MSRIESNSDREKLSLRDQMTVLGLSLITVSVIFIGSAYISMDGMIDVRIAYDFNLANDISIVMLDEDTLVASNQTFTRQDMLSNNIKTSNLLVVFDTAMASLNNTEMNIFLTNTTRHETQYQFNNVYKQLFVITPSFIILRSLEFMMKLPTGNRIAYISFWINFIRDGYMDAEVFFYGILKDTEDSLRTIGKDKIIIRIDRIACDLTAYDNYYNFMNDDITYPNIPTVYPYQITYSIERTSQSLSDMFRSG